MKRIYLGSPIVDKLPRILGAKIVLWRDDGYYRTHGFEVAGLSSNMVLLTNRMYSAWLDVSHIGWLEDRGVEHGQRFQARYHLHAIDGSELVRA